MSSITLNGIKVFRETLRSFSFPHILNQFLIVTGVNLTTVCYSNSTGESLQCQCEEQFVWSCDQCHTYGVCSNFSTPSCGCINGLPSDGGSCEPITSTSSCPRPPADNLTTTTPTSPTTPATTATSPTTPATTAISPTTTPMSPTTPATTTPMSPTTPATTAISPTTTATTPATTAISPATTAISPTTTPTTPATTAVSPTTTSTTPTTTPTTPATTPTTPATTAISPTTTPTTAISPTTTPTSPTQPPPPPPPPTTSDVENLSFTMNIEYDSAYNKPTNRVYRDANEAIQKQSREHISTLKSATLKGFRKGSSIVDYNITATTAIEESEIEALQIGIFQKLSDNYSMIVDSPIPVVFDQPFLGENLILTCGPVPPFLKFNGSWTTEWRRNGELVLEDSEHKITKTDTGSTLTVYRFFITDKGNYECRLKEGNIYRQKSGEVFIPKVLPLVHVMPVTQKVKCVVGDTVTLKCSVNSPYSVEFKDLPYKGLSIEHEYKIEKCPTPTKKFICQEVTSPKYQNNITLTFSIDAFTCVDESVFGVGNPGDRAEGPCELNEVGKVIAECQKNSSWKIIEDKCILKEIQDLLDQSQYLTNNSLAAFLEELRNVTIKFKKEVIESYPNINALVEIFDNLAKKILFLNTLIDESEMEDILYTVDVLVADGSKQQWDYLNTKYTAKRNPKATTASSLFLLSLETITSKLQNNSFNIATPSVLLNKTTFTDTFSADFNSSVAINIPQANGGEKSITVITFDSMDNVLPARDEVNSTLNVINGKVVLVQSGGIVNNISFAFDITNDTLGNPKCVFWNFNLFDRMGGWDDEGCMLTFNVNKTVTCTCNHLTSYSILMSPFDPNFPELDYITYVGVAISMASLVICLIIEAVIWRKIRKSNTSYLRHVSIVNIALSLLIANIWFIIGANISYSDGKNKPACTAATFFIHFFYLALFFWMLASALLLLYRTVSVFGGNLSKYSLLAIGFCLGYGAPLIIAVITIAVTAPSDTYIRETGVCWLNWSPSKALLAFVIPALIILAINLGILLVVLYKMLRRRAVVDAAQAAEKSALVVIARTLAFLTPFFGLTWGLGIGTMIDPYNRGVHISFAFFNSLQGFFILLFGTLLDKKVRSEIALMSQTSRGGTRSTTDGASSSNGIFRNWRRGRDGYNVSSNESGVSQSYINT